MNNYDHRKAVDQVNVAIVLTGVLIVILIGAVLCL